MTRMAPPPRAPQVHLARGAPPVRGWSRYQATDAGWSLCGCNRKHAENADGCAEEPAKVTCAACLDLMAHRKDLG